MIPLTTLYEIEYRHYCIKQNYIFFYTYIERGGQLFLHSFIRKPITLLGLTFNALAVSNLELLLKLPYHCWLSLWYHVLTVPKATRAHATVHWVLWLTAKVIGL